MDILATLVTLLIGGVLITLELLMPIIAPALGLWVALFVGEMFMGVIPLVGKPLAKAVHFVRHHYEKLFGKILGWGWKLVARFFRAVGRGLLKVVKWLLPAAWRGLVRIGRAGRASLSGSSTPPASPPPP